MKHSWRNVPPEDPDVRRAFLDVRRLSHRQRYDELFAATYDRDWGAISPSHEAAVRRLLALTRPGGVVLDAACGTGKYWPLILDSGRTVVGADQSAGMLDVAKAKHPYVPTHVVALQELRFETIFDAVMCVDAMEDVGPEDWPTVLARLRDAAKLGAHLYLTVELLDEDEVRNGYEAARARGEPVVPGEDFDGTAYHFFPEAGAVHRWIDEADLAIIEEYRGDDYAHLLVQRPAV
jgi:SAM-dependent methyltransferase